MTGNSLRLRTKKVLLKYPYVVISYDDLLRELKILFGKDSEDFRYFIKTEYYNNGKISTFVYIEFFVAIDKSFNNFDIKLGGEQMKGVHRTGISQDLVLMYLLKSFQSKGFSMEKGFLTNFPQNEIDSYTRVITNKQPQESETLPEEQRIAPNKTEKDISISTMKKLPNEKQLKNINKFLDNYKNEENTIEGAEKKRKALIALRNYYYKKTLDLGGTLKETIKSIINSK